MSGVVAWLAESRVSSAFHSAAPFTGAWEMTSGWAILSWARRSRMAASVTDMVCIWCRAVVKALERLRKARSMNLLEL